MGRPAYKPTPKDREQIKMLSGMGVAGADIAALIGISANKGRFKQGMPPKLVVSNK